MTAQPAQITLDNYGKFLRDTQYSDVKIKVGEESNVQTFYAHSPILAAQSSYFACALSKNWAERDENNMIYFEKPNTTPRVFELILKYIYSASVDFADCDIPTILDLVLAADELILEVLVDYLQTYLVKERFEDLGKNFARLRWFVMKYDCFRKLHDHYTTVMESQPETIIRSNDLDFLDKPFLRSILERQDLYIDETEIFQFLVSWGKQTLAFNNSIKEQDVSHEALKDIVCDLILLVRLCQIPVAYIHSKMENPLYPDGIYHIGIFELLNRKNLRQISRWIKETLNSNQVPAYHLLLRGSRDGFGSSTFHKLCDSKGPTVTIIKIKETGKLIGGYATTSWHSNPDAEFEVGDINYDKGEIAEGSFIFSLASDRVIQSKLKRGMFGIFCGKFYGPQFGLSDISVRKEDFSNCFTMQSSYDHPILDDDDGCFEIEDYEVYQVIPMKTRIEADFFIQNLPKYTKPSS